MNLLNALPELTCSQVDLKLRRKQTRRASLSVAALDGIDNVEQFQEVSPIVVNSKHSAFERAEEYKRSLQAQDGAEAPNMSALERAKAYKLNKKSLSSTSSEKITKRDVEPQPPTVIPEVEFQGGSMVMSTRFPSNESEKGQIFIAETSSNGIIPANKVDEFNSRFQEIGKRKEEEVIIKSEDAFKKSKNIPKFKGTSIQSERKSRSVEIEIITRDGVIKRKVDKPSETFKSLSEMTLKKGIDSKDFLGLNFEDRNDKGKVPAGLRQALEMPKGPIPKVEIITRKANEVSESTDDGEEGLYRPKVSTWGVFPRAKNISETYGGGRTIRPGEALETKEESEARERKTMELLEEYKRMAGLIMDPKDKAECDAAMSLGEQFMDKGKLQEAVENFEKVIQLTVFRSEMHGKALLQKAVCLDSMARFKEAKALYDKLGNHPNMGLRKQAQKLSFGFEAAENLKIGGGNFVDTSAYRKYFEAFAYGYNTTYTKNDESDDEDMTGQVLPYLGVLLLPLILLFGIIVGNHLQS